MDNMIRQKYKIYTSTISNQTMAISFELASFMWKYINKHKCIKILDLGSGYSSFVFRYYQKSNAPSKCKVVSVDTSMEWLTQTNKFLSNNDLNLDHLYTFEDFKTKRMPVKKYDFILYDLGNMSARSENLEYILSFADTGCPIIIDDVHKSVYRKKVEETVNKLKKHIVDIKPKTLDAFGRYAYMIK